MNIIIKAGKIQWKDLDENTPYPFGKISTCGHYAIKCKERKRGYRFTLFYSSVNVFQERPKFVYWAENEDSVIREANAHRQMKLNEAIELADVTVQFNFDK